MQRRVGIIGSIILIVSAFASQLAGPRVDNFGLGLKDNKPVSAPNIKEKFKKDKKDPPLGLAAIYRVSGMPPVLNQGDTPRCVSFSSSTVKAWQDYLEWDKYFNFDEQKFSVQIGTTAEGAYMSDAVERMTNYGYPVYNVGRAAQHKISSSWSVELAVLEMKQAIYTYGPVLVIGPWYNSWFTPNSEGILPKPDKIAGGHAFVIYGWDDSKGWRLRNSWGTGWGVNGDAFMSYSYLKFMYGATMTIDEVAAKPDPTPTTSPTETPKITPKPTIPPTKVPTDEPTIVPTPTLAPTPTPTPVLDPTDPPVPTNLLGPILLVLVLGIIIPAYYWFMLRR